MGPDLGWRAMTSVEGDVSGVSLSSPARKLLVCPSGSRYVRDGVPWHWFLQRNQALELLGGEMKLFSFVSAGGRRCSTKTKARKTVDWTVFFYFLGIFFVFSGYMCYIYRSRSNHLFRQGTILGVFISGKNLDKFTVVIFNRRLKGLNMI